MKMLQKFVTKLKNWKNKVHKLNKVFENVPDWVDNDIVIHSTVTVRRNVDGKIFPSRSESNLEDGLEIFAAIKDLPTIKHYKKIANQDGVCVAREGLMERGLVTPCFNKMDRPGSHILVSKDLNSAILINEIDHLAFLSIENGFNLVRPFKKCQKLVNIVDETINYAYNNKYGYLTSYLENCGYGVRFSVKLFAPGIFFEGQGGLLRKILDKHKCVVHGAFGEGSCIEGAHFTISSASDRLVEQELLMDNVKQAVRETYELEIECRNAMHLRFDEYFNNIMGRFGAMKFQVSITFEEALNGLPLLYVGAILGIFSENDAAKLRKLMFMVSPAELSMHNDQKIGKLELGKCRANLIGETLDTMEVIVK
jgi:protein arginine kinase